MRSSKNISSRIKKIKIHHDQLEKGAGNTFVMQTRKKTVNVLS